MRRVAKLLIALSLAAVLTPLLAGCDGSGKGGQLPANNGTTGPAGGNGPGGGPGGNGPGGGPGTGPPGPGG